MAIGLPYDSDAGRDFAADVTAHYVRRSVPAIGADCRECPALGPAPPHGSAGHHGRSLPGFYGNREPFLDVIRMHRAAVNKISKENVPAPHLTKRSKSDAGTRRWRSAKSTAIATRR